MLWPTTHLGCVVHAAFCSWAASPNTAGSWNTMAFVHPNVAEKRHSEMWAITRPTCTGHLPGMELAGRAAAPVSQRVSEGEEDLGHRCTLRRLHKHWALRLQHVCETTRDRIRHEHTMPSRDLVTRDLGGCCHYDLAYCFIANFFFCK